MLLRITDFHKDCYNRVWLCYGVIPTLIYLLFISKMYFHQDLGVRKKYALPVVKRSSVRLNKWWHFLLTIKASVCACVCLCVSNKTVRFADKVALVELNVAWDSHNFAAGWTLISTGEISKVELLILTNKLTGILRVFILTGLILTTRFLKNQS